MFQAVIWFVIIYGLFAVIIKNSKNGGKSRSKDSVTSPASHTTNNFDMSKHVANVVKQAKAVEDNTLNRRAISKLENKSDDWLAKQIAYERSIKPILNDMFMLKEEHSRHCDADILRREHFDNCDATDNQKIYQSQSKMSQSEMNDLKNRILQRMG